MSNAPLAGPDADKVVTIKNIFEDMAYNFGEVRTKDLISVKYWVQSIRKSKLTTVLGDVPFEKSGKSLTLLFSEIKVEATFLDREEDIISAYKKSCAKLAAGNVAYLDSSQRKERLDKFVALVKKIKHDLIQLESFAGQHPAWLIEKSVEPRWLGGIDGPLVDKFRTILERDTVHVFFHPNSDFFSVKNLMLVMLAAVQTDVPLVIFLSAKDGHELNLILPIIYVVEAVNSSKMRKVPIDIIMVSPDALQPKLLKQLAKEGITKRLVLRSASAQMKESLETCGTADSFEYPSAAAINFSSLHGKSVHHVVDVSGDVKFAAKAIFRTVWLDGSNMTHRCRSILFVHQPVYTPLLINLQVLLEPIIIGRQEQDVPLMYDFVERNVKGISFVKSAKKWGAKFLADNMDFTRPTIVYEIGMSSELVVSKTPGLGHVLVVIPYRSTEELVALHNSLGEADQVHIQASTISSALDKLEKLNAREIFLNGKLAWPVNPIEMSWMVMSHGGTPAPFAPGKVKGAEKPSIKVSCAEWIKLSTKQRLAKLEQLLQQIENGHELLAPLLSHYMETFVTSPYRRSVQTESVAAIILADAEKTSVKNIVTAISACVLRERPVVVISIGSKVPKVVTAAVTSSLPSELVSFLEVASVNSVIPVAGNWELVWIFQGENRTIPLDWIPSSTSCKVLLMNSVDEVDVLYSAETAIMTAYKKSYV